MPTLRFGTLLSCWTAYSLNGWFTIIDVLVTMPLRCAKRMPLVTPEVMPKSSALTIRRHFPAVPFNMRSFARSVEFCHRRERLVRELVQFAHSFARLVTLADSVEPGQVRGYCCH